MLHTGFDAVTDSLELQCIRHTFPRMFDVMKGFGLPYKQIGATMVAWTPEQVLNRHQVLYSQYFITI